MTPPPLNSFWTRDGSRGRWMVWKIGRKYAYLRSAVPGIAGTRAPLDSWPGEWRAL